MQRTHHVVITRGRHGKKTINPILFDHYINKNLYPQPKTKSDYSDQDGWQHFVSLGLLFVATPFFLFS